MVRRGRCRCGSVLDFEKGPDGYKTRCPSCGSVVRLNPGLTKSKKGSKQTSAQTSQTARDVPTAPWSPFPSAQRAERAVTCELCNTVVPVEASNCPGCGSTLAVTITAPALAEQPASPWHAPDAQLPGRAILYGVIAGAAVIAVVAAVVVFLMRH